MEVWAEMARIPANTVERTKIIQAHKNGRCGEVAQLPFIRLLGWSVAPIWRDNVQQGGKSSLGALLRERKVTGRDASLPAPLLAVPFELVARETVGALPQTPAEAPPLHPARGNFPLDPFRAIELVALPILLPRVYSSFAACSMFFRAAESISFTRLS